MKTSLDVIVTSDVKISQILWLMSSDNPSLILHTKFYASTVKNKRVRGGRRNPPPPRGPASF